MKFFDQLKKRRTKKQPTVRFRKEKKSHGIFFFSSFPTVSFSPIVRRGAKVFFLGVLPFTAIAVGTTMGILTYQDSLKENNRNEVVVKPNVASRRIFLISQENDTVPLTVSLEKKHTVHEEILEVFSLLKESSSLANDSLKGVIPDTTRVISFTLDEGKLDLHLSTDFLSFQVDKQKLFEAITFTMLQFDQVQSVSITVDDIVIMEEQTGKSGINVQRNESISSILGKEMITLFYEKTIGDKALLIPVSSYVETKASDTMTFRNAVNQKKPTYTGYQNVKTYRQLSNEQSASDGLIFQVEKTALIDESVVNQELYNLMRLSYAFMGVEEEVSFTLEGEVLEVDGIYQEESKPVSSIIVNEVKI